MKRYCQTLKLRNNRELIAAYCKEHSKVWLEIQKGILSVGIIDMQIYIHDNILFMIVDTSDDFDWISDNEKLSKLPRQEEWEAYMSKFQDADPNLISSEKWTLMNKVFELDKSLK